MDIRKAQFDKAQSVARIIQETAIAVVKLTGSLNPLDKALIPLVIGISAAQIAAILATPIPRYKHGKDESDNYEGAAIVGDGGRKEAIIREDGTVEITPSTPTLTHVGKRDIVLPDANQLINYVLAGHMGGRLSTNKSVPSENSVEKEIKSMKKEVVAAIRKIPQSQITTMNPIKQRMRYGHSINEHLTRSLGK